MSHIVIKRKRWIYLGLFPVVGWLPADSMTTDTNTFNCVTPTRTKEMGEPALSIEIGAIRKRDERTGQKRMAGSGSPTRETDRDSKSQPLTRWKLENS